eukprot:1366012-Ditylum_brightwellii.AAC.1
MPVLAVPAPLQRESIPPPPKIPLTGAAKAAETVAAASAMGEYVAVITAVYLPTVAAGKAQPSSLLFVGCLGLIEAKYHTNKKTL